MKQSIPVGLAALLLVLFHAGCSMTSAGDDGVIVRTDRDQYFYGQTAELTIDNRTDTRQRVVAFTGCSTRLQRRDGVAWTDVGLQSDIDCSLVRVGTIGIASGGSAAASLRLAVDQDVLTDPPSEFRLETTLVGNGGESRSIQSNPFRILIPKR